MSEHSLLSPSAAHRWTRCPASLWECRNIPNITSEFAEEGTRAHALAALILEGGPVPENTDPEMLKFVMVYVEAVLAASEGCTMFGVEQKLDTSLILGVPGQTGTADAMAVIETAEDVTLLVDDLKYGVGVAVEAEDNEQMIIYGLAALDAVSLSADITRVALTIHQPRLYTSSTVVYTVEEMEEYRRKIGEAARKAFYLYHKGEAPKLLEDYVPGEKQCKFCPAKGTCEALANKALTAIVGEFDDLTTLGTEIKAATEKVSIETGERLAAALDNIELIELWIKSAFDRAKSLLLTGEQIPGWKVVQGKQGNRAWTDEGVAERTLKSMKCKTDEMYSKKLISPTAAEKLLKDSPAKWKKLENLITRADGSPTIAPMKDKRPALTIASAVNDFENINAASAAEEELV